MNILPPPEFGKARYQQRDTIEQRLERLEAIVEENEEKLQKLLQWCRELYHFLQYPIFQKIRIYPRTTDDSDAAEGDIIYNSTDDKFRGYTSSFEDFH